MLAVYRITITTDTVTTDITESGPNNPLARLRAGRHVVLMATEAARHALYARLEEVIGDDHAGTLMEYLPMEHSGRLATKDDIVRLEDRFDRLEDRFDRLEDRFDRMHELMHGQLKTYSVVVASSMTGLTAIFAVVVGIIV